MKIGLRDSSDFLLDIRERHGWKEAERGSFLVCHVKRSYVNGPYLPLHKYLTWATVARERGYATLTLILPKNII